jgi:hypothetical protein
LNRDINVSLAAQTNKDEVIKYNYWFLSKPLVTLKELGCIFFPAA